LVIRPERRFNWTNSIFLAAAHLLAMVGLVYPLFIHFSWWTLALAVVWLFCCSISVTAGYHRLFSHPTYRCAWPLKLFYLLFGAASVQNSALLWASDHRRHHLYTDQDEDPYNIKKGFWWAHFGWVLYDQTSPRLQNVPDLMSDRLLRFQHAWYVPLALSMGLLPIAIACAWGDPLGALFTAGWLRLVLQYHMTFSVNSFAHWVGKQPFSTADSSRDSVLVATWTLGEGYHNFHHRFPADYRNGCRWHDLDATKWWVRGLSFIGVTRDLKSVSARAIQQARETAALGQTRAPEPRRPVAVGEELIAS
jgi:stearoyl-CoA desaturase (delta-9 desaturase)